jgi:homoserine dehydrogenase
LQNTAAAIRAAQPSLVVFGFGAVGQSLNNQFDAYREKISGMTSAATGLVGIAVSGDDGAVREVTRKFSLC